MNEYTKNVVDTIMKRKEELAKNKQKNLRELKNAVDLERVSLGDTRLDIMTGGGLAHGDIVQLYGDSSSGKTLFALESIAHAKKKFGDKLHVKYLDSENGVRFKTKELFNYDFTTTKNFSRVAAKTVQEFISVAGSFVKSLSKDECGVLVLDSLDGVVSDQVQVEYEERIKKHEKGEVYDKGSFDLEKQKFLAKMLPILINDIEEKNVILIFVSQEKDKIGATYGPKTYIGGGKGPAFYSTVRLGFKEMNDPDMLKEGTPIGAMIDVYGRKVRSEYPFRHVYVPILFSFGVDSIASDIDYLYDLRPTEGAEKGKLNTAKADLLRWSNGEEDESLDEVEMNNDTIKDFLEEHDVLEAYKEEVGRFYLKKALTFINTYEAKDLKTLFVDKFKVLSRDMLIAYIEDNNLEEELSRRVTAKWVAFEESIKPKRKARF